MDEADAAQVLEEGERAGALAACRARSARRGVATGACLQCGADIRARRAVMPNATRCVACETERERRT